MTKLFLVSSKVLEEEPVFIEALHYLPEEEQRRATMFKNKQRQRIYVCSRLLLQTKLREYGYTLSDCASGKNGKPYLKGSTELFFNLSHSGDYVLLGLSDREIGVDIESVREKIPRILSKILSSDEVDFLSKQTEEIRRGTFFRLWTMKEAFVKQKGERIFDWAKHLSMICEEKYIAEKENRSICSFFKENYVVSVCEENNSGQMILEEININKLLNI